MRVVWPFKLASREVRPESSIVKVGNVEIGGNRTAVIAGGINLAPDHDLAFVQTHARYALTTLARFLSNSPPGTHQGVFQFPDLSDAKQFGPCFLETLTREISELLNGSQRIFDALAIDRWQTTPIRYFLTAAPRVLSSDVCAKIGR